MSTYVDQRALENLYTMLYDAINRIIQFPYRDAKFQTQQFLLDSINLFKYEPYNAKPFIKLILQLNSTYQAENKFDEANNLLDEYLEKYKTGEQVQYLMELMEAKLQNHYHAKKIDEAKILVDELISIQKSHENWHGLAKSYNSKGVIYHMNQELEKGLEFYHKAVKVMNTHEITDPQLLDRFYYSLATINYHYLANYEEAEKYYLMGYNIAKEYNNEPRMSFFLDHLGLVNYKKTEYHKALEYHYKAEVYLNTNKTSNDYIFHQLQVSLVYLKIEKYQKSLESLLTVFTNVANTSDGWAVSIPYIILANLIYYSSESIDLNLFDELDELSLDIEQLLDMGIEKSRMLNYSLGIVNCKIEKIRLIYFNDEEKIIVLLKEIKQLVETENTNPMKLIFEEECQKLGIDVNSL